MKKVDVLKLKLQIVERKMSRLKKDMELCFPELFEPNERAMRDFINLCNSENCPPIIKEFDRYCFRAKALRFEMYHKYGI